MKQEEILAKVKSGEIDLDEANKLLSQMQTQRKGTLYCKVSPKGAVSVYGLQRMPVTLYAEQWERLLDFADNVREFVKDNDSALNRKDRQGGANETES